MSFLILKIQALKSSNESLWPNNTIGGSYERPGDLLHLHLAVDSDKYNARQDCAWQWDPQPTDWVAGFPARVDTAIVASPFVLLEIHHTTFQIFCVWQNPRLVLPNTSSLHSWAHVYFKEYSIHMFLMCLHLTHPNGALKKKLHWCPKGLHT